MQILESDTEPRKYALCCSDSSGVRKATYGQSYTGLADGLEDLISVYKSELKKRTLEGYLHVDIDYSLERHTVEAAPSKQTLEARIAFYNLLRHILRPKITLVSPDPSMGVFLYIPGLPRGPRELKCKTGLTS